MLGQFGSFILIAASLIAMLICSLQIRMWLRVLFLLLAAGALTAAYWLSLNASRPHLFEALVEDWQVVWKTFFANSRRVESAFAPVLDLAMVIATCLLGLTALALTPGRKTERLIRPVKKVALGACVGSIVTLAIVGIGFGAQTSPNAFVGYVSASDVHDADTFGLGDTDLRLWGIDAPENQQKCFDRQGVRYDCGSLAKSALVELLADELVHCFAPNRQCTGVEGRRNAQPGQSFGRPLVTCVLPNQGNLDLAEHLLGEGHATTYERDARAEVCYGPSVRRARDNKLGIWQGSTLMPRDWRNSATCREWFENLPAEPVGLPMIVDCNALPPANDN